MKILCLADLHLHFIHDAYSVTNFKNTLKNQILEKEDFDCIVISGDIFESEIRYYSNFNPYKYLREIFNISEKIPIICCLGNHEFAGQTIDEVLKTYEKFHDRFNIHYLDIEGAFQFKDINFVGNVFWYDSSLQNNKLIEKDVIVSNWLDATIKNFVPSIENKKCQDQIFNNLNSNMKNILVTHCVPHFKMNWFSIYDTYSIYNQYSGCKDFLKKLIDKNVVASMCGHTHKRMMDNIYNIDCINVGNDYFSTRSDENNIAYVLYEL